MENIKYETPKDNNKNTQTTTIFFLANQVRCDGRCCAPSVPEPSGFEHKERKLIGHRHNVNMTVA